MGSNISEVSSEGSYFDEAILIFSEPGRIVTQREMNKFPYNAIGSISRYCPITKKRAHIGSGFLISPYMVISNAHTIWNNSSHPGKFYDDIRFNPSLFGFISEKDEIKVKKIDIP